MSRTMRLEHININDFEGFFDLTSLGYDFTLETLADGEELTGLQTLETLVLFNKLCHYQLMDRVLAELQQRGALQQYLDHLHEDGAEGGTAFIAETLGKHRSLAIMEEAVSQARRDARRGRGKTAPERVKAALARCEASPAVSAFLHQCRRRRRAKRKGVGGAGGGEAA